ncbi:hypothetical protein QAD02_021090 [Eretmocerus hayati]|uniref:Uncharacterized protein n=1 Tax=Eretmocerus hayati TaxID=131215 RepID=A0ACC2PPF8_9HYME|nr:hypothetical protein QAD02_021090 [Eretmocerus hayati]
MGGTSISRSIVLEYARPSPVQRRTAVIGSLLHGIMVGGNRVERVRTRSFARGTARSGRCGIKALDKSHSRRAAICQVIPRRRERSQEDKKRGDQRAPLGGKQQFVTSGRADQQPPGVLQRQHHQVPPPPVLPGQPVRQAPPQVPSAVFQPYERYHIPQGYQQQQAVPQAGVQPAWQGHHAGYQFPMQQGYQQQLPQPAPMGDMGFYNAGQQAPPPPPPLVPVQGQQPLPPAQGQPPLPSAPNQNQHRNHQPQYYRPAARQNGALRADVGLNYDRHTSSDEETNSVIEPLNANYAGPDFNANLPLPDYRGKYNNEKSRNGELKSDLSEKEEESNAKISELRKA